MKPVETIKRASILYFILDFKYSSVSNCAQLASGMQARGSSKVKPLMIVRGETILIVSYICSQLVLAESSVVRPSEDPNEVRRGAAGLHGTELIFVWFRHFPAR